MLIHFIANDGDELATAAIWSDPNNDGNPSDAVLLGTSLPTDVGTGVVEMPLTSPVDVGPNGTRFFVGVFWQDSGCGDCLVVGTRECEEGPSWKVD